MEAFSWGTLGLKVYYIFRQKDQLEVGLTDIFKKNRGHPQGQLVYSFLDELEHYKSFLFLKNEKIEDCSLKNQADGQVKAEKCANNSNLYNTYHK